MTKRRDTTVELARDADAPRLGQLLAQLSPDLSDVPYMPSAVRQANHTFIARDEDGEVVGFILVTYTDLGVPHEGGGSIELLVVDETHRTSGVGAALVEAAVEWLRSEGIANVFVSTEAGETTPDFYKSLGFTVCDGPWMVRVIA